MVNVYAFPPVAVTGAELTRDKPVSVSRSMLTGKRYVSAAKRDRRMISLVISGASRHGAGHVEVLKELLAGGESLVRIKALPINRFADAARDNPLRQYDSTRWVGSNPVVPWQGRQPAPYQHFRTVLSGSIGTADGWPVVTVTGLPAYSLAARPGEFLQARASLGATSYSEAMVLREAWADETGTAVIRLLSALSYGGYINIGTSLDVVCEPLDLPRAMQPVRGVWSYTWNFAEIFEDEVEGGFTELDPWT